MKAMSYLSKRGFGTSVYLWTSMPRLGPKATEIKQQLSIPKGTPKKIDAFDSLNVQKLQVGMRHSAVISQEGQLYTFGSGNWGVLGHGSETDVKFDSPKLVEYFAKKDKKVIDVALGEYHTIALTSDGGVYTWGYAGKTGFFNWMYTQEVGALGHGDKKHSFTPKRVEFFDKNNLKVTKVIAGMYHCCALASDGNLYSWGRGLYGVLGNGSNKQELSPEVMDEFRVMREQDPENKTIQALDAADEFNGVITKDGSLYVWGKNDRGQLGVGSGIGIDMVESENVPVMVPVIDSNNKPHLVRDFVPGQNTMIIRDEDNNVYKVGLRLDYTPKQINIFEEDFKREDVKQIQCGRKHYVVLDKNNNMMIWGNVFKEKSAKERDGFGLYFGDSLFNQGKIRELSMKYSIFGALVDH